MKKLLALVVCLFTLSGIASAEKASYEPLFTSFVITYPDMLGTNSVQGTSKSICNAVLYDVRGYFAIKKDAPCVKAFENANEAGAYTNIGFVILNKTSNDPEGVATEPFYYDSEYIENDRVQDEGDYYTFYISPEFMNENEGQRAEFRAKLKDLLAPFGGVLKHDQIVKALTQNQEPAKDLGFTAKYL